MYNNQIINSTNKTKTTWNIIKTETNWIKGPTTLAINSYQNSPEAFNKYFLWVTKINTYDSRCDNKQGYNINKSPKYYLSKLYHKLFPSIKFKNTSNKKLKKLLTT